MLETLDAIDEPRLQGEDSVDAQDSAVRGFLTEQERREPFDGWDPDREDSSETPEAKWSIGTYYTSRKATLREEYVKRGIQRYQEAA